MTRREMLIFALIGLGVWLWGAVMFRLGGALMFQSGPLILLASGASIALSVCLLLRATMQWRKAPPAQSLTAAVVMALPGLFGDVAYIPSFTRLTGLHAAIAPAFAALLIFGNASLLAYGLVRSARA
jgi:hypothetical protein